ncbi:Gamma-butyrobetaine hydroxylase-like, N-terminal [Candidatus Methylopumilus planktonicus]|uniref:gamma-butyrobetaine hydroxylase-like domain-containing protein n=1 Tax=Candidatus Methylopumilus planktonicus TaxID=1581557 RepID=UPI003BEEC44E
MTTSNAKIYPLEIKLHQSSNLLEIKFNNLTECMLSSEFLRVHSPSAEVRGHGPGQETLQVQKENVTIENIEPIGQYAIKLTFSDGHNTGIYTWDYLYELAATYDALWEEYLRKLSVAGIQRTKTHA